MLRNRKWKVVELVFAFLLISSPSLAGVGRTAAQFLTTVSGARPGGMGGAFTAVADDINAICWNPAGLAFLKEHQVSFMYNDLAGVFQVEGAGDMYQGFAAYLAPWGEGRSFALGLQYEEQGKIAYTAESPEIVQTYSLGANCALIASYAQRIAPRIGVGLNLKFISTKLWDEEANAYALDIGTLYHMEKVSIGASFQNWGTKLMMKDASQGDPLPERIKIGFVYKLMNKNRNNLILAMDFTRPTYSEMEINTGAEYWYADLLALRIGYLKKEGRVEGMTQGLGIKYKNYRIDFANIPWGELGKVQRISLSIRF